MRVSLRWGNGSLSNECTAPSCGSAGLTAEILKEHIRLHIGSRPMSAELGEELIDLVRAYLK
jgi:hypothetical protein